MALSDNLRDKRIEQGLTMEELAVRVGLTRQAIDRYERNLAKPQPEVLVALAQSLNTTAEWLVIGKEQCSNGKN